MSYKSPIEVYMTQLRMEQNKSIEDGILKAVRNLDIVVAKDELIKALQYDREQYDKGYEDGYNSKASEVAREIFEELERDFQKRRAIYDREAEKCGWHLEMRREYEGLSNGVDYCLDKIAELKKKYTEEGK